MRTLLSLAILALLLGSCRKDELFTDDPGATLTFSQEEVLFDTVFALSPPIGTVTKRFRVLNPNAEAVRVDIALEGGTPSPFRINVDGSSGISFDDVEILGGDSIYVFVEASLDQSGQNTPFIHEDNILFLTNGNEQRVKLVAWGQDAHYFRPDHFVQGFPDYSIIAGQDENGNCATVTWPNDKPYVIYGYAVVDSCAKLIIDPGVRVFVHGGGGLWIYRWGQIEASGTVQEPITFQSDRLEPDYADLPGQWDRIWINDGPLGQNNLLKNVVIKNALVGIQCENFPLYPNAATSEARLILDNVEIYNCSAAGLLSRNYSIWSTDLLVGDCGQHSVALTGGGAYKFDHTTIANLWSWEIRNTPAFIMTNTYAGIDGVTQVRDIDTSVFENSIVHGNNTNEFQLEFNSLATPQEADLIFRDFLVRTDQSTTGENFEETTIYRNQNPGFVDQGARNFHLGSGSYAIDKGSGVSMQNPYAFTDMDGVDRIGGLSDLGCYEYVP